jgi:hypothetical protein
MSAKHENVEAQQGLVFKNVSSVFKNESLHFAQQGLVFKKERLVEAQQRQYFLEYGAF